jgi:tetratricopeptide (TPR) repeat protein
MFIAMARYLGLPATYQEVDMPPDWSLAGESFLFSQHVNAHVDLGTNLINVVDFYGYNMELAEKQRIVSDERGRAHYFNNIAVDYMLADDTPRAFADFYQSIQADRTFAPAWINLGILHRRAGLAAYAEAAYLQALDLEPSNMSAMSNLSNLYEEEGYPELAAFYDERVQSHRLGNPYYRYKLAQTAVMEGDYAAAIGHLEFAIDLQPQEHRFCSLLGVAYLMSGDRAQAQHWMARAESLAVEETERQRYHSKLEWIMSQKVQK